MNIFVLDPDPVIAAAYHCDQHLHKMILESAQMLSTVARTHAAWRKNFSDLYKPTHINHPCNDWLRQSPANCLWLATLAFNLNSIRMQLGCESHASMRVIELASTLMEGADCFQNSHPDPFIFTGDPHIQIISGTVPEKYRRYYRSKHTAWALDKGRGMTYKGRPVPDFMKDLIQ